MLIQLNARILNSGENGNTEPKLIFDDFYWSEWDLTFCVHGEKLRWHCDWCYEELTCEWCQIDDHDKCSEETLNSTKCLCVNCK